MRDLNHFYVKSFLRDELNNGFHENIDDLR